MVSVSLGRSQVAVGKALRSAPLKTLGIGLVGGVVGTLGAAVISGGIGSRVAEMGGMDPQGALALGITGVLSLGLAWLFYIGATQTDGAVSLVSGFAGGAALTWAGLAFIATIADLAGVLDDATDQVAGTARVAPASPNRMLAGVRR